VDPLTLILVDDHPVVRSGLRTDLAPEFTVVAEADNATDAIAAIDQHRPDLVVCDIHMPGGGITVASHAAPITNVVMLSVSEAERDVLDAVAAGAVGYLPKSTPTEELRDALRQAARGEPVFPPDLAVLLLGEFRRLARTATGRNPLSDREREVLTEVAKGHSYRTIGARLHISPRTVENHVRNILDKLHLERRDELISYARQHDLK
jgi:DNA-binding NarL/FixJ family response regulator